MDENHSWRGWGHYKPEDLTKLAIIYRTAKKICRKCYKKLPADTDKCTNPKCHNTDLRFKKNYKYKDYRGGPHNYKIENDFYRKIKKLK